jgi:hypothetical protein
MKVFAFVFSFEELNTNVFVNALMRTRSEDELFVAYCPKEFAPLFFSADLVIHIPDTYIKYSNYSEVSETFARGGGGLGYGREIYSTIFIFRLIPDPQTTESATAKAFTVAEHNAENLTNKQVPL